MTLGALLATSPIYFQSFTSDAVVMAGGVLHGAASAILLLGWGNLLCSIEPRRSAPYIVFSFMIYGLSSALLSGASASVLEFVTLALPAASAFFLVWSLKNTQNMETREVTITRPILKGLPWGMFTLLVICAIVNSAIKGLIAANISTATASYNLLLTGLYSAIFLVLCVWLFGLKRDDPEKMWPLFIIILFGSLLFYSSFSSEHLDMASSFVSVAQGCITMFFWVFLAAAIYRQQLPRLIFFGLGNLVFRQVPSFLSDAFAWIAPGFYIQASRTLAVAITSMSALLVIIATIVLLTRQSKKIDVEINSQAKAEAPSDALPSATDSLAARYGLTSRESEVVTIMAHGYTLRQIGEALYISHDTVRSHSKSIHRKLGIHHKQELLKMIEQESKEYMLAGDSNGTPPATEPSTADGVRTAADPPSPS